jgi:hypothetical protein
VGSFGVERHGLVDSTVFVLDRDVPISQWRSGDGAAEAGLLGESFGDLVCQVAGVELCDARHDPVHEHPGRGLIDVLAGGYERDAGLLECEVDGDVIGTGPRQSIELVDHAVVDLVLADVGQQVA